MRTQASTVYSAEHDRSVRASAHELRTYGAATQQHCAARVPGWDDDCYRLQSAADSLTGSSGSGRSGGGSGGDAAARGCEQMPVLRAAVARHAAQDARAGVGAENGGRAVAVRSDQGRGAQGDQQGERVLHLKEGRKTRRNNGSRSHYWPAPQLRMLLLAGYIIRE